MAATEPVPNGTSLRFFSIVPTVSVGMQPRTLQRPLVTRERHRIPFPRWSVGTMVKSAAAAPAPAVAVSTFTTWRTKMLENIVKAYNEAIFDTDRDQALAIIHQALDRGVTPEEIIFQVVTPAIELMVKAISQDFDANLAQHFMTAQIAAEITEEMLTKFQHPPEIVGRMVIGTAHGDLHTLGKRIVMGCLKSMMIEVTDLGVNVPAEKFVDEAVSCGAEVIGISAMMVHTARGDQGCLKVRQLLRERGLEERIKIVVGGAPYRYDPELYHTVGADAWAEDAITGGKVINDLIKKVRGTNQ